MTLKNKRVVTCVAAGVVALTVCTTPANAFFTTLTLDLSVLAQAIKTVAQLKQEYAMIKSQYAEAKAMAQQFTHFQKSSWQTLAMKYLPQSTANRYGETASWSTMANGLPGMSSTAWQQSVERVSSKVDYSGQTPGSRDLANLATVETIDGASVGCMATIAQYRADTVADQANLANLESSVTDDTTATNSGIEQANLANAQAQVAATQLRNQGLMSACLAEQQVLANKALRDSSVNSMNYNAQLTADQNSIAWSGVTPTGIIIP